MKRCTSQNQPISTGITLQFSNKSVISPSPTNSADDSLAIQILQSMTLVDDDIFPQETRQELLVVHTYLVCRDNNRESRTSIRSGLMGSTSPSSWFAFSHFPNSGRCGWLQTGGSHLRTVIFGSMVHDHLLVSSVIGRRRHKHTGIEGANFSNSMTQLFRTERGQTIRNGPHVPLDRK